ncbi:TPA: SemiSWEET transporter [Streptococcus suis]
MIGFLAACLTTFGFLPQVIQVVKTKETQAISLGMYSMSVTGIGLWLIHGILIGDAALIVANSISFILSGIILFYKLRYK